MAPAHDPSHIASAVLTAAGDMLFFPAEDGVDGEWLATHEVVRCCVERQGRRRASPLSPSRF